MSAQRVRGAGLLMMAGLISIAAPGKDAMAGQDAEAAPQAPPFSAAQLVAYLRADQHPDTGLPQSFLQSEERLLDNITFTYDVAVSAIILSQAGSLSAADRALKTYRDMPMPSSDTYHFNTAYNVATGRPALEYRVHGGPMFWMAIAFMRYGQASGDALSTRKGIELLEWARAALPHSDGGVAMSHRDFWTKVMSVENNWVYYAALRLAIRLLPEGAQRDAFLKEKAGVRQWLTQHRTDRGDGDPIKALDVYTHALLVGPDSYLEDGAAPDAEALAQWARAHIAEMETLFRVPGTALYDYTDAKETQAVERARNGWLEGTEQASLAYRTWAPWFKQQGDAAFAKELLQRAALSHAAVLRYALPQPRGVALPNTSAPFPFQTFSDGWVARPRSEPALNSTNWAYLAETGYNPFTTDLTRRAP